MIITKQGTTNVADMLAKDALGEKVLREAGMGRGAPFCSSTINPLDRESWRTSLFMLRFPFLENESAE